MKNLKIFLLINLMVFSAGTVQIFATVRDATYQFVQNHAEKIAVKILTTSVAGSEQIVVTWKDVLRVLDENEMRSYLKISGSGFGAITGMDEDEQFIVGAVQAALDNAESLSVGFAKSERNILENDMMLYRQAEQDWRPWIQKHSNKIVRYLNENNIEKIYDFEDIEKACKEKNIQLKHPLAHMVKEYLIDEINAALELINPSASFDYQQYFDKKQNEYINDYLIPKLIEKGHKSITVDQLERFLDTLPNKSHTGKSVENKIGKFSSSVKKSFANWVSDHLVTNNLAKNQIANIFDVLGAVQAAAQNKVAKTLEVLANVELKKSGNAFMNRKSARPSLSLGRVPDELVDEDEMHRRGPRNVNVDDENY